MNILIPLTYTEVFHINPHNTDYFKFIASYPKNQLLQRLAFLSSQADKYLKSLINKNNTSIHQDFLDIFLLPESTLTKVINCLKPDRGATIIAYCRDSILYAMEEILQSDLKDGQINKKVSQEFANNVFYYLLCINDIYYKSNKLPDSFTVEELNATILPNNNTSEVNSLMCCIKGVRLINYLDNDSTYKLKLNEYINQEYKCTLDQFLGFYLRWGFSEGNNITTKEGTIDYNIFRRISHDQIGQNSIQRLLNIKLSPIYQTNTEEFVILDKSIFIEKVYYQFIYEFWFNCIKITTSISAKVYFSKIGVFFEDYSAGLLKKLFSYLKHPSSLALTDLEYDDKGKKEFADFYARQNKKLVLAEIKLGNLNDNERYSGNTQGLYSKGREEFYKNIKQLNTAIGQLDILQEHFDKKLPIDKRLTVYPICILNDKIHAFPTMKFAFSETWKKERSKHNSINVKPLIILQIEELEHIVFRLNNNNNKEIWKIFNHYSKLKNGIPTFNLSKINNYPLVYDEDIKKEFQGYLDRYKN